MSIQADQLLASLPKLHFWGGEPQVGGLTPDIGRLMVSEVLGLGDCDSLSIVETGAGATTLLFLCLHPKKLVSVAPDSDLRDRILTEAKARGIETDPLHYISMRSETALPTLAEKAGRQVDVALIDGNHGWPSVFVDFCYLNQMLRKGGLLFIDDLQLWSVLQLFLLLESQPGFELAARLHKFGVFQKTIDDRFLPGHDGQPFIVANSTFATPSCEMTDSTCK